MQSSWNGRMPPEGLIDDPVEVIEVLDPAMVHQIIVNVRIQLLSQLFEVLWMSDKFGENIRQCKV